MSEVTLSLRKARKLEQELKRYCQSIDFVSELKSLASVMNASVEDIKTVLDLNNDKATNAVRITLDAIKTRAFIRTSISAANISSGINDFMAERSTLNEEKNLLGTVLSAYSKKTAEDIKYEAEKADAAVSSYGGRESVSVPLLTCHEGDDRSEIKERLDEIAGKLEAIEDQLMVLNTSTTIIIPAHHVKVVKSCAGNMPETSTFRFPHIWK